MRRSEGDSRRGGVTEHAQQPSARGGRRRRQAADLFHPVEQAFYLAIALALCLAGLALFAHALHRFVSQLGSAPLEGSVLQLLDGLLLVFIVIELVHTVRAVIDENALRTEPFLIVGIVAAIRRVLVITAETEQLGGHAQLHDALLETLALGATVLALGVTIFLVRHTTRSEPLPAHEKHDPERTRSRRAPPLPRADA